MMDMDRLTLRRVRQSILAVGQQYGLGYPETMYRRVATIEMNHNGHSCQAEVEIPARWDGRVLAQHSSDHLLVEDNYLLNIRALLDQPTRYDFARTKTYLNSLSLKFGLIVNFGKKQLQIYGVGPD
jgi:GxxExxY protein